MKGFDAALRMEWVRMTTLRSTALIIALAMLLGLGVAVIISAATRSEGGSFDTEIGAVLLTGGGGLIPLPLAAIFMAVLAVLTVGHDYRHGLVRPVLGAVPVRSALFVARLWVIAAVAVFVTLASMAVNGATGLLMTGDPPPLSAEVMQAAGGYVLLVVLWAWLGAAATWLIRSTAAVLTALLVIPLIIEPLLGALTQLDALDWLEPVVRWLPFQAGRSMVLTGGIDEPGALTAVQGGLVFGAFVAVVLAAGWARFGTADA